MPCKMLHYCYGQPIYKNIHSGNSINCIYIKGTMWTLRWSNLDGGSRNCASTSIISIIWAINSNRPEYPWKPPIKPTRQRKSFPFFFCESLKGWNLIGESKTQIVHFFKFFFENDFTIVKMQPKTIENFFCNRVAL